MASDVHCKPLNQDQSSNESLSGALSQATGLNFLNNTIPLAPEEDTDMAAHSEMDTEIDEGGMQDDDISEEGAGGEDESVKDGYKRIVIGKEIIYLYYICDFCHGPIFRICKKGSEDTKFCCSRCFSGYSKMKLPGKRGRAKNSRTETESKDTDMSDDTQKAAEFNWDEFRDIISQKGAPQPCFKKITKDVKGLEAGMKLEALDKNNPCNYCVATVINVVGHRVQICYDGFGDDEGQDFWCNFQAEELFPIGWCAGNGYPLQPPSGISSSLEDWKTFLTKTLTGALAAPVELFRPSEQRMQLRVHSFQAGTRVECINPLKPDIVCQATVTKSLGPYNYQVSTEAFQECPPAHFFGHSETLGLFQAGWSKKHGIKSWCPCATYVAEGQDGKPCIRVRKGADGNSPVTVKRPRCNKFRIGQKVEAVDAKNRAVVRVATVISITGRLLLLYFDGTDQFQFVDCESEDIYPCGWCKNTAHPLYTCYGLVSTGVATLSEKGANNPTETDVKDILHRTVRLPSFKSVVKSPEELTHKRTSKENKSMKESQMAELKDGANFDPRERFCVNINRQCAGGPYLDAQKLKELPVKTKEGRLPTVLMEVIEHLLRTSKDTAATIEVMQDVTGPRLFCSGKGVKLHLKSLQRYERKERAVKLLKKLSKKLQFCEYLLSVNTVRICPLLCNQAASHATKPQELIVNPVVGCTSVVPDTSKPEVSLTLTLPGVLSNPPNIISAGSDPNRMTHQLLYKRRPLVPIAPGTKQGPEVVITTAGVTPGSLAIAPVNLVPTVISSSNKSHIPMASSHQRISTPLNIRLLSPQGVAAPISTLERGVQAPSGGVRTVFLVKNGDPRIPCTDSTSVVNAAPIKQVLVSKDVDLGNIKVTEANIETGTSSAFARSTTGIVTHLPLSNVSKSLPEEFVPIRGPISAPVTIFDSRIECKPQSLSVPVAPQGQSSPFSPTITNFSPGHKVSICQGDAPKYLGVKHEDNVPVAPNRVDIAPGLLDVVKPRVTPVQGSQNMDIKPRAETCTNKNLVQLRGLLCDKKATLNHSLHVISSTEGLPLTMPETNPTSTAGRASNKCQLPIQLNLRPGMTSNFHFGAKRPLTVNSFTKTSQTSSSSGTLETHNDKVPLPLHSVFQGSHVASMDGHQLKVYTGNTLEPRSPLHSPPPLRPAPAGSLRTVAHRSPPHLIPLSNSQRFEFTIAKPPTNVDIKHESLCAANDMFTKAVQVSPGALTEESLPLAFSKCNDTEIIDLHGRALHQSLLANQNRSGDGKRQADGDSFGLNTVQEKKASFASQTVGPQPHLHTFTQGMHAKKVCTAAGQKDIVKVGSPQPAILPVGIRPTILPVSSATMPTATTTVTVTLTYVPVHSNSKDKFVYVPLNRAQNQNNQKVLVYTPPGNVAVVANPMSNDVKTSLPCKRPAVITESPAPKLSIGSVQNNASADEASQYFKAFRIQGTSFRDIESRVREAARKESEKKEKADKEKKKNLKRRRTHSAKSGDNDHVESSSCKLQKQEELNARLKIGELENMHIVNFSSNEDHMKETNNNGVEDVNSHCNNKLASSVKRDSYISDSDNSCSYGNDENGGLEQGNREDEKSKGEDYEEDERDGEDDDEDEREGEDDEEEEREDEKYKDKRQDWRHRKRKRKSLKKRFTRRKGETTPLKLKNKDGATKMYDDNQSAESISNSSTFHRSDLEYKKEEDQYFSSDTSLNEGNIPFDSVSTNTKSLEDGLKSEGRMNGEIGSSWKKTFIIDPLSKVKLPNNPETWSPDQVAEFIKATDCAEHATKLVDQEIDGQSLLLLTREALTEFTGMKLGPALKICSFVAQLKARLRMQQLTSPC